MEFYNPVELITGSGVRNKIQKECIEKNVLIFCTFSAYKRHKKDKNLNELFNHSNIIFEHGFKSNPSLIDILEVSIKYKDKFPDLIIGLGGGSAMDIAKIACVSIPAYQKGFSVNDLLLDHNLFSTINPIDCIQVPTTAGTGSEVTSFATIWDYENQQKKSLNHPSMFAKKAFIDPDFLCDVPLEIALSTGLDALNQAFESIWNVNANEYTRALSRKAAVLSLKALQSLDENILDDDIRQSLANASLFAGISISQTRTSICHSISYPLTLKYGIPHGMACFFSMLEVYKYNFSLIRCDIDLIASDLNQNPYTALKNIFTKHQLNSYFIKNLPSKTDFTNSIQDFITEGRFENNIKKCNHQDLINILKSSYDRSISN